MKKYCGILGRNFALTRHVLKLNATRGRRGYKRFNILRGSSNVLFEMVFKLKKAPFNQEFICAKKYIYRPKSL